MATTVQRKHWWTQLPISWGVEAVLVLALLAGTAFAASQVRSRDATIADQASQLQAVTAQQRATATILTWAITYHEQVAALDGAIIEAYGALETHRAALAKAERGETSEVYESTAIQAAAMAQTQSRIDQLLVQRQVMFYNPPT